MFKSQDSLSSVKKKICHPDITTLFRLKIFARQRKDYKNMLQYFLLSLLIALCRSVMQ